MKKGILERIMLFGKCLVHDIKFVKTSGELFNNVTLLKYIVFYYSFID